MPTKQPIRFYENEIGGEPMQLEPGIYDLPFSDYVRIDAMNFHTLKEVLKSPLHLKAAIDGLRKPDTDTFRLGRAIHSSVLTPQLFSKEFAVSDGCCQSLKSGARKGQSCGKSARWTIDNVNYFCGTHKPAGSREASDVLTFAEMTTVIEVSNTIRNHPAAFSLNDEGQPEATIVFDHSGVRCKARCDWLSHGHFVDLKKCQPGTTDDRSVLSAIAKYGYHQQLAFYSLAVESVQGFMPTCELIFAEDSAPYDVVSMPLDSQSIAIGLAEVEQMLATYKRCKVDGKWPGMHDRTVSIETGQVRRGGLPKWKRDEAVSMGLVSEDSWPDEALRGVEMPPVLTGFDQ